MEIIYAQDNLSLGQMDAATGIPSSVLQLHADLTVLTDIKPLK